MSSDPNQVGPNEAIQKPGWSNPGYSWQQNNGATKSFAQNPGSVPAPAAAQTATSGLAAAGNAAMGTAAPYVPGQIASNPMAVGQYTDGGMALKMGTLATSLGVNANSTPQGTEAAGHTIHLEPINQGPAAISNLGSGYGAGFTGTQNPQTFGSPNIGTGQPQHFGSPNVSTGQPQTSFGTPFTGNNPSTPPTVYHSTPRPYVPGKLASTPMAAHPTPYRANSQFNGVQGTVSNGIGRAGDSLKHLFGGSLGQHQDNRLTKFYQSPTNATVPNHGR